MEDELRREQYSIYLKYDKKYQQELLDLAKSKTEAYNLANKTFWEELKKYEPNAYTKSNTATKIAVKLHNQKQIEW